MTGFESTLSVPTDRCTVWDGNPRKRGRDEQEALTESIRAQGIIRPLIGYLVSGEGRWVIVAGAGRLAAAKELGLDRVPLILVEQSSDAELLGIAYADNVSETLHPVDRMEAMEAYSTATGGATPQDLAARFGLSRSDVTKLTAIMPLGSLGRSLYREGRIAYEAARLLATVPHDDQDAVLKALCLNDEGERFYVNTHQIASFLKARCIRDLDGVWPLGEAFEGLPACDGCQYMSRNTVLFGEEEKPRCLNGVCFRAKVRQWIRPKVEAFQAEGVRVVGLNTYDAVYDEADREWLDAVVMPEVVDRSGKARDTVAVALGTWHDGSGWRRPGEFVYVRIRNDSQEDADSHEKELAREAKRKAAHAHLGRYLYGLRALAENVMLTDEAEFLRMVYLAGLRGDARYRVRELGQEFETERESLEWLRGYVAGLDLEGMRRLMVLDPLAKELTHGSYDTFNQKRHVLEAVAAVVGVDLAEVKKATADVPEPRPKPTDLMPAKKSRGKGKKKDEG